ncbi:hypothetical protein KIH74_33085 [Kineosporia sp. J2-2]|uniref:Uncharacterized protein n=1 Tax=Kineosporia corallincola TaxID=2835133 RepID=A0ABS5TSN8_9ACTN|nr:hypothetical protein [Kineosporia corallincola]MBT0773827.1 hypothetical protein [Kineosporia corallincola]
MTLAYTFWHRPQTGIGAEGYERDLALFHERLAMLGGGQVPGFAGSYSLRVPPLPWQDSEGYEDWYLVDDFAALGVLAEAAVDPTRLERHDALAGAVLDGAGGLYGLRAGRTLPAEGTWVGWARKRPGIGYAELFSDLETRVETGSLSAVWQRQLVLGPAPEFRLEGAGPVDVAGLEPVQALSTSPIR